MDVNFPIPYTRHSRVPSYLFESVAFQYFASSCKRDWEEKTHIVCTLRKGNYPVTTKIDRPCPIWKLTTDSQVKLIFQPSVSRTNNLSHNSNAKRGGKKLRYKTSPLFFLVNKMIERWNGEMAKLQNILKHGMSCCEKQKFYKNGVVMKSEIIYSWQAKLKNRSLIIIGALRMEE